MLTSTIARVVRFSMRHAYFVIATSIILCAASIFYTATHFKIDTDIAGLIDAGAGWKQRTAAINKAFPQRADTTLAVVEAPAAELADRAANELAAALSKKNQVFESVSRPGGGEFFERNGLLFLPTENVDQLAKQLTQARPLLNRLAADPSLTGLANLLSVTMQTPLMTGQVHLADMATLLDRSATTVDATLAGKPAALSWRALVNPETSARSFILIQPILDYSALEAGSVAANAIRQTARDLKLDERYGATVNLTGPRPLADEEFGSVSQGAVPNAIGTLLTVLFILWLAVRSGKMIFAVFTTMLIGLAITAALGLLMVGKLNMISVAFAVLFVGLGVDFGIQFAVRYREERHANDDIALALSNTARGLAIPLSLAALAVAASFFSFLPTEYRGVSELGLIAGVSILFVAFPSNLTLLPALITVLRPAGEAASPGFKWLAPVDRFTERHRKPLLFGTVALVLLGSPLLFKQYFDFNPLHLKDPHSESMTTLMRLANSPEAGTNDVQLLAPSLEEAAADARALQQLPQVGRVITLNSFIPDQQQAKLATISDLATQLKPVLDQQAAQAASDEVRARALRNAAGALENAAADNPGPGANEAQHLAESLRKLASADAATRDRAERAFSEPLKIAIDQLRTLLTPSPILRENLPAELSSQWVAGDGRALVNISPRVPAGANPNDDAMIREFSRAVLQVRPLTVGGPINILASADIIVHAFVQAGILAVLSITVILWIALRRFVDVLLTLIPLLVSAVVTMEVAVLLGVPLNFANIIALPLLLGIGVAFKIYYVVAWRNGQTNLLQSGLTQAVVLSAATTATAFGSLWLSHHPGTASMGELLALSLACTLIGAVFFQPMLMGKPRDKDSGNIM